MNNLRRLNVGSVITVRYGRNLIWGRVTDIDENVKNNSGGVSYIVLDDGHLPPNCNYSDIGKSKWCYFDQISDVKSCGNI